MATVLSVFVWVLVVLFAALAAVAVTPLRLEVRAAREEALRFTLALRPLGRFGPRIFLTDCRGKRDEEPKAADRKPKKAGSWRRDPRVVLRAAIRLLSDILVRVRIEQASVDLRFGSGDPAETGQAFGMLAPLIFGAGGLSRADIRVEPVFDRIVLSGRAALDLSVVPALLLPPFVRFGWAIFGPGR